MMQEIFNDTEPLKNRLLRNGFRMYLLSFIIAPAGYLIKLMVSRELSVEDVGLVYSIIGFIGLLSAFNDLGLTEALQYYLPHYIIDKEYGKAKTILAITRIIQFIGGAIIGGGLYIAAPWLAEHYFHSLKAIEILRLFCLYFLFINLFQVLQSVFIALQNIKLQYITEAVRMWIITLCLGYLFFYDTINLWNFSALRLISAIIGVVISLLLFYQVYYRILKSGVLSFDIGILKKQRAYAWRIMLGMQAAIIYNNIGQQYAIGLLGNYEAGIRTNYMTFYTIIGVLVTPVISYLFPLFTELYKKNEYKKILLMKKYLNRSLIIGSICIAIGGWYFSEQVIVFLFGEKFQYSGTLFKWNSLFFYFILATWIQWSFLSGAGYVKERLRINIIGTAMALVLSYIGIKILGLYGLIAANIITHIYFYLHTTYYIKKYSL